MRVFKSALLVIALVTTSGAQSPESLLSDMRLTVHTLLREDIFAGFMNDEMDRFSRAERNLEVLLKERPTERANLLAWKGGMSLYRAVGAHEAGKRDEFTRLLTEARDLLTEASRLRAGNDGVAAITGGSYALFADRLPEEHRAAAWSQAYDAYALLWKQQGAAIEQLPVHFKGEVLAGLTQSAQRTGRNEEAAQYLEKMLTVLHNTPYAPMAQRWKEDPSSAATTNLTCKNCHNPGRLSARLNALNK